VRKNQVLLLAPPVFLAWPPCFPWAVCWCGGRCSRWASCPVFAVRPLVRCLVVSSSVLSGVAASLVRSFAVPGAAAAAVAGPVAFACPLVSGSGVPALLRVGSRVVPSSSFLPVVSGVVSSLSWDARRLAVVAVVGGRSLVCLASGLGGVGSPAAVALVAALRVARASGAVVDVWGAPGSSGRVCPGYFCGVSL
jgi:hypothetical protein